MAIVTPTYIDLYGSEAEAITFYKDLFTTTTLTDPQITNLLNLSYTKIEPIFGAFRVYTVGEETVRNEHIKKSVSFEANSLAKENTDSANISNGGLNTGSGGNSNITEEKIGNITTKYGKSSNGGLGGLSANIATSLNLLSIDASIILSRYVQKTYGMGLGANQTASIDHF